MSEFTHHGLSAPTASPAPGGGFPRTDGSMAMQSSPVTAHSTSGAGSAASNIRLWSPASGQVRGPLGEAIATSLAAAFSSRVWARTPMPVGHESDPHSARGVIATLGKRVNILLASATEPGLRPEVGRVLGCVLGGALDEELIDAYALAAYGAKPGDGLLAYIGLIPSAQGTRVCRLRGDVCTSTNDQPRAPTRHRSRSLASLMFSSWLDLPAVRSCPAVFVRTRQVIGPILHLAAKHGFRLSGRVAVDFRGEQQDRMVFRREGARAGSWSFDLSADRSVPHRP